MLLLVCFAFISLCCASAVSESFQDLKQHLAYSKCCPSKQKLDKNLKCVDANKNEIVETGHIFKEASDEHFFESCSGTDYCMDLFKADLIAVRCGTNASFFEPQKTVHKCCPPDRTYDLNQHKCVKQQYKLAWFSDYTMAIGLASCWSVVIDYEMENFNEIEIFNDHITYGDHKNISATKYCMDTTTKNSSVLRICHDDYDACKNPKNINGTRCIKKCCADNQIHINWKCAYFFNYGIDLNSSEIIAKTDEGKNLI